MADHIYAQVQNGKVIAVTTGQSLMVELETKDDRLLGTSYVDGQFVGYKAIMTADKTEMIADSVDILTLTITVKKWDDTPATDFNGTITIDINASRKDLTVINGVATYAYKTSSQGVKNISTSNVAGFEYIAHGSLTIQAYAESEEL